MADTNTDAKQPAEGVPATAEIPSPVAVAQRVRRRTQHINRNELKYSTLSKDT